MTLMEDYLYALYDVDPIEKESIGDDVYFFTYQFESPKEKLKEMSEHYFNSRRFRDYKVTYDILDDILCDVLIVKKDFHELHKDLLLDKIKMDPHPLNKHLPEEHQIYPNAKIKRLPNNCSLVYGIGYHDWEFWPIDDVEDPISTDRRIVVQFLIYKYCIR